MYSSQRDSIKRLALALLTGLLLLGCGEPAPTGAQDPRSMMPKDANLAALYQRSCYACHVNAGSRAPLTGDVNAWQPRLEQGMDQLLTHVIDGFGGMPPLGLCMDCNAEDFEALIHFMATPAEAAQP
ncbi:cytochrome c5 family protein [Simiduia litorea]|uniref:c-type cytochrome n=1 Tax=Simiduia litorea TaxID=1435348 RepID=UPI0036F3306D